MIVIGVDPDLHACHWVAYDGEVRDHHTIELELTAQAGYWKALFERYRDEDTAEVVLAVEGQFVGVNPKVAITLAQVRGHCEAMFRLVFEQDPIVVLPREWQTAVGIKPFSKRKVCEAAAAGFADHLTNKRLPGQHLKESFCIAVTTFDLLRLQRLSRE